MKDNDLKQIDGTKIRRQYFNYPLAVLCAITLGVPYAILVISLFMGKSDLSALWADLRIALWTGFGLTLPILLLRTLNKYCFGRIICVLSEEGIHYPKGMVRWETVERLEYAIDAEPRYKSDNAKAYRAIVYTKGGKHIILNSAPMSILYRVRKYDRGLSVQMSGVSSFISAVLVIAAIVVFVPLYMLLLISAPGASAAQIIVFAVISVVLWVIRIPIFDRYAVEYRFWRRILPIKWLSYLVLTCYYLSYFVVMLILFYFPGWVTVALLGIYMGVVQPPIPRRRGTAQRRLLSYEELYDLYVNKADYWEKIIEKNKKKNK